LRAEEDTERLSSLMYASKLKHLKGSIPHMEPTVRETGVQTSGSEFKRIVSEIRGLLVTPRGRSEEEKRRYGEMLNKAVLGFEEDRRTVLAIIHDHLSKLRMDDSMRGGYGTLAEAVFAEVIGMNVLELILKNKEELEELQVVGKRIFEVRGGVPHPSAYQFESIKDVERIQQNLVLFNNEVIGPRKRWAEVRLQDGARVTMTGFGFTSEPTLTIRFYTLRHYDLNTLCLPRFDTINERMRDMILDIIHSGLNMVVIGPTNSGKTNFMKAVIGEMPDHERIIIIEPRFELALKRDFPEKNIIEYEVDEEDIRHNGGQAFKLALRQSPKRICHAEIRDDDANIYVRACTRGHAGSITSLHANKLEDVPDAITDMCMLDKRGMNPDRLRKRITELVTQIGFELAAVNGKRKVVRIGEYVYRDGEVIVKDLVRYNHSEQQWEFP
jgi:pilus assembly protein CpaF